MNDIISLTIALAVLGVSILGYLRSRYWARRAESAREEALLASYRAHDSAMEAEQALLNIESTDARGTP